MTVPGCFDYILRSLTDDAKVTFKQKAKYITPHMVTSFDTALKAMAKHIFPTRSYREQKRYLSKYHNISKHMKLRKFVT